MYAVEGNGQRLDGGAMFGNAPRALWQRWMPPDEQNRITLACRSLLLIDDNNQKVLIEVGIGDFFSPEMRERFGVIDSENKLLAGLKFLGLQDSDIDFVVLTHLHFDHAGGLLSSYSDGPFRLLFPNAKILVGENHWKRATHPHPRDRASFIPELIPLLERSGRLTLLSSSQRGVPELEWLSFRESNGHTIGLLLPQVQTPSSGPLLYASDLIPGAPWVRRAISMGYDRFPELLVDEKEALLNDLLSQEGSLFFVHDPKLAGGKLVKNSQGQIDVIPIEHPAAGLEFVIPL